MCNKYDVTLRAKELRRILGKAFPVYDFRIDDDFDDEYAGRYFYPGCSVPAIISGDEEGVFRIVNTSWGIPTTIRAGAKSFVKPLNNKRDDKLIWKYASMLQSSRCILPMSSIIEWPKDMNGNKYSINIPYRITPVNDELFFSAGLIEQKDDIIYSTMITTSPSTNFSVYHNRMPAVLTMENAMDYMTAELDLAKQMISPDSSDSVFWKGEMLLKIMGKTEAEKIKKKSKLFAEYFN